MRRIRKEFANADGWTDWLQPITKGYLMACCDCGLVHRVEFRVLDGRAQFRMRRAPVYTRRERKRLEK